MSETALSLDQVTAKQLREMKHALGMNYKKKPYRNYFYCDRNDKDWSDLVSKGWAVKTIGWDPSNAYFKLTFEAVKLVYGKRMSEKCFKEL